MSLIEWIIVIILILWLSEKYHRWLGKHFRKVDKIYNF